MSKRTNSFLVALLFIGFSWLGYKTLGNTESEAYSTESSVPQTTFERHFEVLNRNSESILNANVKSHPVLGDSVVATLRAEKKQTHDDTRQGILEDTYDIFEHSLNEADSVKLIWKVQIMNAYDVMDDKTVMVISVSRDDVDNVDWSSMNEEKLKEIASHFQEESIIFSDEK